METITLLKLALALLIAAQGPNVTPELRAQAIFTANTAIEYANTRPISSGLAPQTVEVIPKLTQNSSSTRVNFGAQGTSASGVTCAKDLRERKPVSYECALLNLKN